MVFEIQSHWWRVILLRLRSSKLCAASFYWCPHNQHSPVRNLQHSSCIGLSGRAGYKRSDLSVVSWSFVCYLTCCMNLDSDRHQPYRQLVVNKVGLCASLFLLLLLHCFFFCTWQTCNTKAFEASLFMAAPGATTQPVLGMRNQLDVCKSCRHVHCCPDQHFFLT